MSKERTYNVKLEWETEVEAESSEDAAKLALEEWESDEDNLAFDVKDVKRKQAGEYYPLSELKEDEDCDCDCEDCDCEEEEEEEDTVYEVSVVKNVTLKKSFLVKAASQEDAENLLDDIDSHIDLYDVDETWDIEDGQWESVEVETEFCEDEVDEEEKDLIIDLTE